MNFFCDKCKQKYHVADDKVRGRAVTRFRCKKCDNIIELQGNSLPPEGSESQSFGDGAMPAPSVFPGPMSGPPPVAPTSGPAPVRRPRPATATVQAAAPLGPSAPRSVAAPSVPAAASAPSGAVARAPAAPAARQRSATTTGPAFGSAGFGAPRAGAAGGVTGPARNPSPISARPEPQKSPSASSILNASETGWYAGIRDLPVGPLTRKELSARVQAGDVTPDTLVWREGLDDWRPLRGVDELGDLLRIAAQQMSGNLLDEMGKRPPSTPPPPERPKGAQVVPIGSARSTAASPASAPRNAPSVPPPSVADDDDEATKVSGMSSALAAQIAATRPIGKAAPPAAPTPAKRSEPSPARRPAPTQPPATPFAPAAAAVSPSVFDDPPLGGFSSPVHAPVPAARPQPSTPPPPASTAPLGAPASPAGYSFEEPPPATQRPISTPAPVLMTPAVTATSVAPPPEKHRPGGIPVGVWILTAGIGVSGILGGILIGRRTPMVATVATPAPAVIRSVAPTVAQPLPLPEAVPEVVAAPVAAIPDSGTLVVAANTIGDSTHPHDRHNPRPTAAPALTAEQLRLLRGVAGPTGPAGGPIGSTQLRVTQTGNTQNTGSTSASRGPAILNAFRQSRVADACWQNSLRMNPALGQRATRVVVTIGVNATGRFSEISVQNSPDPTFDTCLHNRLRSIPQLSPGEAMSAETSINLSAGG